MKNPVHNPAVRVFVAGAALSLAATTSACSGKDAEPIRTNNPPGPEPLPDTPPAPDKTLPSWDEVESGHPAGATNPPVPLLAVTKDGQHCYKEWYDGRAMPAGEIRAGGRVIDGPGDTKGTEIACDPERVKQVLDTKGEQAE